MYNARPRKRLVTRPDEAESHLPHEVVGILVAQALDWDTQRIVEAFTIALKQANEQNFESRADNRGGEGERTPNVAGQVADAVASPDLQPSAPEKSHDGSQAPANALNLLEAKGQVTDPTAQPGGERRAQSIAEVRQQFITLGELVLDAIEAVDRSGGEAVD
jgi:hypothetical protein